MEDQSKFLSMLEDIKSIAQSQGGKLTRKEIDSYLGGMELNDAQNMALYQYLGTSGIEVEGYKYIPDIKLPSERENEAEGSDDGKIAEKDNSENDDKKNESGTKKKTSPQSDYNRELYSAELAVLDKIQDDEWAGIVAGMLEGNADMKNRVAENLLERILEMSKAYEKRDVLMDDIVAEGNLALMLALEETVHRKDDFANQDIMKQCSGVMEFVTKSIKSAMESFIDENTSSKDMENAMLAKVNLLHEAAKYMTEEIGRVPTTEELSEYTKISREEINEIKRLSKDVS